MPPMQLLRSTLALAVIVFTATSARAGALQHTVESVAAGITLPADAWGVAVVACDGTELAALHADAPRTPASNMKLLSSGTAILALGHDFEFRTQLLRRGSDIVLVGDGDPALGDPELLPRMTDAVGRPLSGDSILDIWADAVQDTGLTHVDRLVVDDRIFDRGFVHDSWPADQLHLHYCAGSTGLNFHRNILLLYPAPHPNGRRPQLADVRPAVPFLPVDNRLKAGAKNIVSAMEAEDGKSLVIKGTVKERQVVPISMAISDMPLLTGRMLADRLERRGIDVDMVTRPTADERFADGTPIGPAIVTPMAVALERCNAESRNIYADCLMKRAAHEATGRPGSWRDGSALVRREVRDRTGTDMVEVTDGSGMSRLNAVSPMVLARWLASFQRGTPEGDALLDSLSTPEHGTINRRFETLNLSGCTLQGKTGLIRGVSALSGLITAPDGTCAAFSVLVNGLGKSTANAKALQKGVLEAVAAWLARSQQRRAAA